MIHSYMYKIPNKVESPLSDTWLTDFPRYPMYHTQPSTLRYPTKIG